MGNVSTAVVTVGIPGSGKSTHLRDHYLKEPRVCWQYVCRDNYRFSMGLPTGFVGGVEPTIQFLTMSTVKALMQDNLPILVDETNTRLDGVQVLAKEFLKHRYAVRFLLFPVDPYVAHESTVKRRREVPLGHILRMHRNLEQTVPWIYEYQRLHPESVNVQELPWQS